MKHVLHSELSIAIIAIKAESRPNEVNTCTPHAIILLPKLIFTNYFYQGTKGTDYID